MFVFVLCLVLYNVARFSGLSIHDCPFTIAHSVFSYVIYERDALTEPKQL